MSFPSGPFPFSERLRFRLPLTSDAAFYLKLLNEPDYVRFISDAEVRTEDAAAEYIKTKVLGRFSTYKVGLWLVELIETEQPVGICGLVIREELTHPDLGYGFLKDFRGQGIAREAGRAVLDFAQKELNLRTLCAITDPQNMRSAKLLTDIGFKQAGQRNLESIGAVSDYYIWTNSSGAHG